MNETRFWNHGRDRLNIHVPLAIGLPMRGRAAFMTPLLGLDSVTYERKPALPHRLSKRPSP